MVSPPPSAPIAGAKYAVAAPSVFLGDPEIAIRTTPVARSAPPPMKPTVEIVALVLAESIFARPSGVQTLFGQRVVSDFALLAALDASRPNTAPSPTPTTPTPPRTKPAVRLVFAPSLEG